MRAIVNTPATGDVAFREVAAPEPGPGDVLIDIRAVSVNRGEILNLPGNAEGWRPGWDVAGVVAASGNGFTAGQRVVALSLADGSWAEQIAVPAEAVAAIPDAVGFAEAATLPVAALTALRLVRESGTLLGRRVLVTGAAGGVGRILVQLATAAGARVTAVARNAERAKGLDALGAAEVVTDAAAAEGPFDAVYEAAGGASLTAALNLVGPGGTVFSYGNSSGEPTPVSFFQFFGGHEQAVLRHFVFVTGAPVAPDLAALAQLVADGKLSVEISLEREWEQVNEVLTAVRDRQVTGKAVLTLG
ncbi:zinc-binding dehydrogenase [Streptacidiphilus sp. P02-A3a]|uniref:zinc-binding dehydrogenase n=1 Tax=Streptacidiphilus sp. P02-A3a TaxID=2704468 RepID=UPI0015F8B36D|nr:zinc-binding dehydrogenase [Streptacidiphilus sp. P02-A3a]QMU67036.1 zinc-binding dehydrogenase [Streptacidiphilus sp. P02-A3a]